MLILEAVKPRTDYRVGDTVSVWQGFAGWHNGTVVAPYDKRKKTVNVQVDSSKHDIHVGHLKLKKRGRVKEALSPTERTRRYNKRHPKKVRAHLKATQEDRVERNRARRNAVKKHGKKKMENKDVHHVDNVKNSKRTRIVKRDHGPDKKS